MQDFDQSANKLWYAYSQTPGEVAKKSKRTFEFLKCKVAKYETLKIEIKALKAEIDHQSHLREQPKKVV